MPQTNSNSYRIHSEAIFHGLPDLPVDSTNLTAVVTGANGISGSHMLRVLSRSPHRWKKIYALSRRPPGSSIAGPDNINHLPCDFLSSPSGIAKLLRDRDVRPDYIFWFSYVLVTDESGALDWSDTRLISKNNLILSNFLSALTQADALPKRFIIQFGGKWYGVHLGASQVPCTEDQPPLPGLEEKNLYYTQHRILTTFCANQSQGRMSWAAGLPPPVIGCAEGSNQTLIHPLLIYAAVQKYLGKSLDFPGDVAAWWAPQSLGNAVLNSYQYEWMALAPQAENQMFNVCDDDVFTWGVFWPQLAKKFGMRFTGPREGEGVAWKETPMPSSPPPHGFGGRTVRRSTFSFVEWAKEEVHQEAWSELAEKHGLREREWMDVGAVFGRADVCCTGPDAKLYSMSEAKKAGWFGFVNSCESMLRVMDEFVQAKVIPDPSTIVPREA